MKKNGKIYAVKCDYGIGSTDSLYLNDFISYKNFGRN